MFLGSLWDPFPPSSRFRPGWHVVRLRVTVRGNDPNWIRVGSLVGILTGGSILVARRGVHRAGGGSLGCDARGDLGRIHGVEGVESR